MNQHQDRSACWNYRILRCVGITAIAGFLLGCEGGGGGGGGLGEGHDFGPNDANLYAAFGDSITAGSCLDSYGQCWVPKLSAMLGKTVINDSVPGSETSDGLDRIYSLLDDRRPGFLLILYGVNDIIMGRDYDATIANLRRMVQIAKDNKTIPVIATLTPVFYEHVYFASGVERVNAGIRQLAEQEDVALVDLDNALDWNPLYSLPDGLHPNDEGNTIMAQKFYDVLE